MNGTPVVMRRRHLRLPVYPGQGEHSEFATISPAYRLIMERDNTCPVDFEFCETCNGNHLTLPGSATPISVVEAGTAKGTSAVPDAVKGKAPKTKAGRNI